MIAPFAPQLVIVAAVGWVSCIVVSLLGIAGVAIPMAIPIALFFGVFPLQLCGVLLLQRQMAGVPNQDLWKIAFRGCPPWLRYAIWASWGYAFLSFLLITNGEVFDAKAAGFVAAFYAVNLGIFVTTVATADDPTECAKGHPIGPYDKFCRECGVEIKRNTVKLVS